MNDVFKAHYDIGVTYKELDNALRGRSMSRYIDADKLQEEFKELHGGKRMLGQLNLAGKDMVEVAIERIKTFEPPDGYYLAFSGGKDSVVIKRLCEMAGVKFDAHYNLTSVDPPEVVQFVKSLKDVYIDLPRYRKTMLNGKMEDGLQITMWNLIPLKKMPPSRMVRYCCQFLKESQGHGRFVITGVRWAESTKRKSRGGVEFSDTKTGKRERMDPDNPDQEMIHICQMKSQRILNPIIDWKDDDVWEFINEYNVPYVSLYDQGYKRVGCIGCPLAGAENQKKDFERYPKYKRAYIRSFERMIESRKEAGLYCSWETGEDVMRWWLGEEDES